MTGPYEDGLEGRLGRRRSPGIVSLCERRWKIAVGNPFPGPSHNWAAPACRADGAPVVLKISSPEGEGFEAEVEALRVFGGRGAVRLLEVAPELRAMLLERAEPGRPLSEARDEEEAVSAAVGVMKQLWRSSPARHPFATTSDWGRGFERMRRNFGGGTGPIPERHAARAETLFAELLESEAEPILLHGDLHHENVLDASATGRGPWLAIDPKGVVGEPAYETGALLRNPMGLLDWPRANLILARRVRLLSEGLGFEPDRVLGWGFSQAVLAAYWGWEDEGKVWEQALTFAELLTAIRP